MENYHAQCHLLSCLLYSTQGCAWWLKGLSTGYQRTGFREKSRSWWEENSDCLSEGGDGWSPYTLEVKGWENCTEFYMQKPSLPGLSDALSWALDFLLLASPPNCCFFRTLPVFCQNFHLSFFFKKKKIKYCSKY